MADPFTAALGAGGGGVQTSSSAAAKAGDITGDFVTGSFSLGGIQSPLSSNVLIGVVVVAGLVLLKNK